MTIKVTLADEPETKIAAVTICKHNFDDVTVEDEMDYIPSSSNPDVEVATAQYYARCKCGENVSETYEWGRYFLELHDDTTTKIKDWLQV